MASRFRRIARSCWNVALSTALAVGLLIALVVILRPRWGDIWVLVHFAFPTPAQGGLRWEAMSHVELRGPRLHLERTRFIPATSNRELLNRIPRAPAEKEILGTRLTYEYEHKAYETIFAINVHIVPVLALLIVPPCGILAVRAFRRRPWRAGHCRACGYNLTGNVPGVCPECGAAVAG